MKVFGSHNMKPLLALLNWTGAKKENQEEEEKGEEREGKEEEEEEKEEEEGGVEGCIGGG